LGIFIGGSRIRCRDGEIDYSHVKDMIVHHLSQRLWETMQWRIIVK